MSDEFKYKKKYKELKRKVGEIEQTNERFVIKINRAKKRVQRLKVERSFLFGILEETQGGAAGDSHSESETEAIAAVEKQKRPEKETITPKRPEKDPNAPKRPANAFFMYCQLQRSQLKEEHQDASLGDLTKMLSASWKTLDPTEKKKYYDMYEKDKERYEKEMSSYSGANGSHEPSENGARENKKIKIEETPRQPPKAPSNLRKEVNSSEGESDNEDELAPDTHGSNSE
ncbi:non-histone protein [Basidiobolus ranarum]|uniref:Non-histone protein n=1 Tax=Basidiobolus ranarum TaxID=34480 RepID=A0ABR2VT37_9FUNG